VGRRTNDAEFSVRLLAPPAHVPIARSHGHPRARPAIVSPSYSTGKTGSKCCDELNRLLAPRRAHDDSRLAFDPIELPEGIFGWCRSESAKRSRGVTTATQALAWWLCLLRRSAVR
jgi:hypothetical protein